MVLMRDVLGQLRAACLAAPAVPVALPAAWDEPAWSHFLDLARLHRIAPLLGHLMQTGLVTGAPAPVVDALRRALHQTRLQHALAHERLHQLDTAFREAGVPMIPLKGPRLADEAYPAAGLRQSDDLDILVEPCDAQRARQTLTALGYAPLPGSLPHHLVAQYHFHTQWIHPATQCCVELHTRPADRFALPPQRSFSYVDNLRDDPTAMPVYLAVHLAKHGIANRAILQRVADPLVALHPWYGLRLIWLLDFAFLLKARRLTADNLQPAAARWRAEEAVAFTRYLWAPKAFSSGTTHGPAWAHNLIVDRLARELDRPPRRVEAPWWLRPGKRTGFRPIRALDLLPGALS